MRQGSRWGLSGKDVILVGNNEVGEGGRVFSSGDFVPLKTMVVLIVAADCHTVRDIR